MSTSSRKKPLAVNEQGVVVGLPYHDSILVGFEVGEGTASIRFRKEDVQYIVHFSEVLDFTISDFWFGSIIANIYQWPLLEAPWIDNDEEFGLKHLYGKRASRSDVDLICQRILQRTPQARLVQVDCSYGGVLSFICASIEGQRLG